MMGSLTVGAAQQTVLRLLEGQKHTMEKWIIHTKFVGRAHLGDLDVDGLLGKISMSIWIYALIFLVFRSENYLFLLRYFKSDRTEGIEHEILLFLHYFKNLSHLYKVTSTSLLSLGTLLLLYVYNVVTVFNMYRQQ